MSTDKSVAGRSNNPMDRTRELRYAAVFNDARKPRPPHARTLSYRFQRTALYASLLMIGIGVASGHAQAQTLNLTAANPSYDVGSTTYSITGLTVADGVSGVITGAGGTLNYIGGGSFILGSTGNGVAQNLNMSGLSHFVFDNATQSFDVGGRYGGNSNSSNTSSTLTLANTNTITASSLNVGTVSDNAANGARNVGIINLGANNTIDADTINVGTATKTSGTVMLPTGGTLILRGTNGSSPVANLTIASGGNSSLQPTTGIVNLGAGAVDALVGNVLIAQAGAGGSQPTTGTLTLGSGTFDATSIIVSQTPTTSTSNATGTLTIGSADVAVQTLTMGSHLSATGTITATVNINAGGTLQAQLIQAGAGTATRTINWSNGTIANYASGQNMTMSVSNVVLTTANPHNFDVEGALATATVSSLLSGAGALTKTGAGTLNVVSDETYSGGTTIANGTMQLGNGGSSGSVVGTIVDNGALVIDRSDTISFLGAISGTGSLLQSGSGTTVLTTADTFTGGTTISAGALQLGKDPVAGSVVGPIVDNAALIVDNPSITTLSGVISGTGTVTQSGSGTTVFTANNTYTGVTTISAGVLQLGDGNADGSVAGAIVDNTSMMIDNAGTETLPSVISGTGAVTQTGSGTTVLTANNTYTGGTTIAAGTLQLGTGGTSGSIQGDIVDDGALVFDRSDILSYANTISGTGGVTQLGTGTLQLVGDQTYSGPTNVSAGVFEVDGTTQSTTTTVAPGATLSGFGTINGDVINQGNVWPGHAVAGDTHYGALTIHGHYAGENGLLTLNAFLGGDGSPSDQLIIDSGTASGSTNVVIHNTAPTVAQTTGDGILVVSAIDGATTTPDAFSLASETRVGALDYRLFRGGVNGDNANNWYLRDDFDVPPVPPEPPEPPQPPEPPLPPDPPDPVLPPGVYPIIGPEVATYGAVQPTARQLGMLTLGTMDQRIGDSALMASGPTDSDHGPSMWARVFATHINDSYQAFAAPQTHGDLSGFQVGSDIWQGQWMSAGSDRWGGYLAYGNADVDVDGLVTNADATGYIMQRTGSLTLHATSAGVYVTHYGPSDWYVDGVMQASTYNGSASTQNARLGTHGVGFMGSLEFGYPFSLPQLGSGFVLEPQAQAVWQQVRFGPDNDGIGAIALGETNGTSGRLGVRGKWQLTTHGGAVWEPYVSANVWRDWGARASTSFDNAGSALLVQQASRFEWDGGVTATLAQRFVAYASLGYQLDIGDTTYAQRRGINGDIGVRYTW